MAAHIRNVRFLSVLFGMGLVGWSAWGLMTEPEPRSLVQLWLVILVFGTILGSGALLGRTRILGRVLLGFASAIIFLYALSWLLLGGIEDAGSYWPGIIVGVSFAAYATYASVNSKNG